MRLFVVLFACVSLLGGLKAAAVDTVVKELQKSDAVTDTTALDSVSEECRQPKETGRCFALFYRYAYDVEKRECVEFIYSGCGANSNNFESKEECERKCLKRGDDAAEKTTTQSPKSSDATASAAVSQSESESDSESESKSESEAKIETEAAKRA